MPAPREMNTPDNWDAASKGYADYVAPRMMESFAPEFVRRLDINKDMDALEVAAGSGALTETLAAQARSLLATDFSPKMVDLLATRLAVRGVANVTTDVMDGQSLALEDGSFDRVACSFGVMLFPERSKGFAEIRRVLKPGGRAMISGWAGPDKFAAFNLFLQSMKTAFPDLPPPASPPPVFSLADPARFKDEMEAAGFEQVQVEYYAREMELDSADQVWSMLTSGAPPVKVMFDQIGEQGVDKLRSALDTIISNQFGDGPITLTNTATIGTGVAPA